MTNTLQKNAKKEAKVKGIAGRKENHTLTYIVLVIFTLIFQRFSREVTRLSCCLPISRWKATLMPGTAAISACTLKIRPLLQFRQRC